MAQVKTLIKPILYTVSVLELDDGEVVILGDSVDFTAATTSWILKVKRNHFFTVRGHTIDSDARSVCYFLHGDHATLKRLRYDQLP